MNKNVELSFALFLMAIMIQSATSTEYSGGFFVGPTMYDMTGTLIIGSFPPPSSDFEYVVNYLEVWPEESWYYFSYVNKTNCILARSRSDFTNFQYIATITYSPTTCQFAIDKVNNFLYYGAGYNLMKSLSNGEQAEVIATPPMLNYEYLEVAGTHLDVVTGAVWYYTYSTLYYFDYSFYVLYPNNTNKVWTLVTTEIQNFIVYDEIVYFVSDAELYQCNFTSAGHCAPLFIDISSQFVTFDYHTNNVYSFYFHQTGYISNFYYNTPTSVTKLQMGANGISAILLSIVPMVCKDGCSTRGNCILEPNSKYNCSCFTNYYGSICDVYCSSTSNCSNHGICDTNGGCDCYTNYYGSNCIYFCENQMCNENGYCSNVNGQCDCNAYYSGANCTIPVINPTSPSLFSANATTGDGLNTLAYYSYQKQALVLNFTTHLIYKEFLSGYEYYVTANSCSKSELYSPVLPLLQPSPTSHLIYWNGTKNECVENSVSKWVDDVYSPKSTLILVQDCSSPTQYIPYSVYYDGESVTFDTSSFSFSPPNSIFILPTSCFGD